jgi:hypothetical protein
MQQRGARIAGMAGALMVAGFELTVVLFAPTTVSGSAEIAVTFLVAALVILLAPRPWAAWVATATAVITGLFTLIVGGMYVSDTSQLQSLADLVVLLALTVVQGGAAWVLHRAGAQADSSQAE